MVGTAEKRFLLVDGQRFHLGGRFGCEPAGKVGLALSKQGHRAIERRRANHARVVLAASCRGDQRGVGFREVSATVFCHAEGHHEISQPLGTLSMFHRATGENQRGLAPLGVGLAQAATLRRLVGEPGIFRIFRERKKFLTSGGKLLVLPKPRLDGSYPQIVVGQAIAESGVSGVVVDKLLPDQHRLAVLGLRLRRLARPRQQDAEVEVEVRQVAAPAGVGGVVVGQLLPDRQRRAVLGLRLRRLAHL